MDRLDLCRNDGIVLFSGEMLFFRSSSIARGSLLSCCPRAIGVKSFECLLFLIALLVDCVLC